MSWYVRVIEIAALIFELGLSIIFEYIELLLGKAGTVSLPDGAYINKKNIKTVNLMPRYACTLAKFSTNSV